MAFLGASNDSIGIKISTDADNSGTNSAIFGLEKLGLSTNNVGGFMKGALVAGAAAATAGVAAIGVASVKSISAFADFQQSMNVFQSVSGATGSQMKQVSTLAKQLGNDITLPGVSAKDAALAMVELSKAGLDVNQSMGASKGVLSLAKAGQLDVASAAEIAANALNAFGMKGDDASKVADILAGAANGSSAGVSDLALGLQQAAAGAARLKIPLNDTVTALGLFSNNGIKGSDAGTSLKTMLTNLNPTSKDAAALMQQLGLKFYDAQGHFIGVRNTAQLLQDKLKGLTDQQREQALATIFGSDSSRAASILAKEGAAGFDKLAESVNKQGAATGLAAAQNSGLKGALDNIKSSVETLSIDFGEKLAPHVQKVADYLNANLIPAAKAMYQGLKGNEGGVNSLGKAFNQMGENIRNCAIVVRDIFKFLEDHHAVIAIVAGAIALPLTLAFIGWAAAATSAAIATIAATWPLLAVGAAIGAVAYVIVNNWGTIKNAFSDGIEWIKGHWQMLAGIFLGPLAAVVALVITHRDQIVNTFAALPGAIGRAIGAVGSAISNAFSGALDFVTSIPGKIVSAFAGVGGAIRNAIGNIDIPGPLGKIKDVIPGFATGVRNFGGGMAVVGERGPELVELPRGSSVYTNSESKRMGMGGGRVEQNNTFNVYNQADITGAVAKLGFQLANA